MLAIPPGKSKNLHRGMTLVELLVCMAMLAGLMFGISMIYFSCLKVNQRAAWKLPPYDEATMAVEDMTRRLRESMLIDSFGDDWLIVVMPRKTSNHENMLTLIDGNLSLSAGDMYCFYLSDADGTLTFDLEGNVTSTGNYLWLARKAYGETDFAPRKIIGESIHPELNPTDPDTGQPQPMFRYYPDEVRLWGVAMCITSVSVVHGESRPQTASSEVYLRNL
jgi:prepilin-type N-terminal cleavage/methylation domain-containing protein